MKEEARGGGGGGRRRRRRSSRAACPPMLSRRVVVPGLRGDVTTSEELRALGQQYGTVVCIRRIPNMNTILLAATLLPSKGCFRSYSLFECGLAGCSAGVLRKLFGPSSPNHNFRVRYVIRQLSCWVAGVCGCGTCQPRPRAAVQETLGGL